MRLKTYRKKPVEIQAMQFTAGNASDVADWCGGDLHYVRTDHPHALFIETLEGTMTAKLADYVIKGVKGEFYPCKPDVFAETYEEA